MSLYGSGINEVNSIEQIANSDSFLEALIVDDLIRMNSDDLHAFLESEQCKVLVEANKLSKPSLMRLSKADDEKRRIKLAAYEIAKASNDPEYAKFKKYTALRKQSIAKIMKKYGSKAQKVAKVGQKNYIKAASSSSSTSTSDNK